MNNQLISTTYISVCACLPVQVINLHVTYSLKCNNKFKLYSTISNELVIVSPHSHWLVERKISKGEMDRGEEEEKTIQLKKKHSP